MKSCPRCAQELPLDAIVCRRCFFDVRPARAAHPADPPWALHQDVRVLSGSPNGQPAGGNIASGASEAPGSR